MTTPEDIKAAYRLLLGRDPESYEVVSGRLGEGLTQKDLVLHFMRSDEFRLRFGPLVTVGTE